MPDPVLEAEHDDVIGRAFDRRLASRLWASARAHHRLVWSSIALFPLVTLVELAQPYLIKIAIDDYILTRRLGGAGGGGRCSTRPVSARSTPCAWSRPI